jgi:hypothetical protein
MNLIILKTDIPHVGPCKESFRHAKACIHLDFVFLAFGEIACAAKLKFLSAMTLFLQPYFCIIIIRFFKKPGSLEI